MLPRLHRAAGRPAPDLEHAGDLGPGLCPLWACLFLLQSRHFNCIRKDKRVSLRLASVQFTRLLGHHIEKERASQSVCRSPGVRTGVAVCALGTRSLIYHQEPHPGAQRPSESTGLKPA